MDLEALLGGSCKRTGGGMAAVAFGRMRLYLNVASRLLAHCFTTIVT